VHHHHRGRACAASLQFAPNDCDFARRSESCRHPGEPGRAEQRLADRSRRPEARNCSSKLRGPLSSRRASPSIIRPRPETSAGLARRAEPRRDQGARRLRCRSAPVEAIFLSPDRAAADPPTERKAAARRERERAGGAGGREPKAQSLLGLVERLAGWRFAAGRQAGGVNRDDRRRRVRSGPDAASPGAAVSAMTSCSEATPQVEPQALVRRRKESVSLLLARRRGANNEGALRANPNDADADQEQEPPAAAAAAAAAGAGAAAAGTAAGIDRRPAPSHTQRKRTMATHSRDHLWC
jgi:hypothetical protein